MEYYTWCAWFMANRANQCMSERHPGDRCRYLNDTSAASNTGQAIYEVGAGCSSDQECSTYEGSKCLINKKFCVAGYPTSKAVVPPTVGPVQPSEPSTQSTESPTKPTKPQQTTPASGTSKTCPNAQPEWNGDPARAELLRLHNEYRAKIAKGEVTMGNGAKARECPQMKKFAMNAWFGEISKTGAYMEQKTGSQNMLLPKLNIRHFARMVWDTNAEMGCGIATCSGSYSVVCQYGKGVGRYGNTIYMMGPTCNQCGGPAKCTDGVFCP
ncbi:SCP-like protein [Ancylostoma duodenale]|uniref:SCP-like protein n=1 Tax=Ancylostoma duodenale TaxID=51022 RepID=A0A0C2G254_9BILA|nr:SCP-like protein [Ancylostoma duodenale]